MTGGAADPPLPLLAAVGAAIGVDVVGGSLEVLLAVRRVGGRAVEDVEDGLRDVQVQVVERVLLLSLEVSLGCEDQSL